MNYFVSERNGDKGALYTAGIKARDDADDILKNCGFLPVNIPFSGTRTGSAMHKLKAHGDIAALWSSGLSHLKAGDRLVIQFPAVNHSVFLKNVIKRLVNNGVEVTALIHDLEVIRLSNSHDLGFFERQRLKAEELSVLPLFSHLIVHNKKMKQYLNRYHAIPNVRMTELGIFDYITDKPFVKPSSSVIIAGNLSPKKAGYAYRLPRDVHFELYGPGFNAEISENISYHGSFPPEKLTEVMQGGFGLVWDGDSADSCRGVWGEYLRYNNPHKTSLYLACGIPVIIWKNAALAEFVLKEKCGIAVASLNELSTALKSADVSLLADNARGIAKKLRCGYYLRRALR